jgi:hypothetical protein
MLAAAWDWALDPGSRAAERPKRTSMPDARNDLANQHRTVARGLRPGRRRGVYCVSSRSVLYWTDTEPLAGIVICQASPSDVS